MFIVRSWYLVSFLANGDKEVRQTFSLRDGYVNEVYSFVHLFLKYDVWSIEMNDLVRYDCSVKV